MPIRSDQGGRPGSGAPAPELDVEVIDLAEHPHPRPAGRDLKPTNGLWLPGHVDREAPKMKRVWLAPHRLIVCRAAVPARKVKIWLPGDPPRVLDRRHK